MPTYLSLLRGINVGGHRRVPMAELRELLESRGFAGLRTYIQSGNLVYERAKAPPAALSGEIAAAIEEHFGFEVRVITCTASRWRQLVAGNPWPAIAARDPAGLHLILLSQKPTAAALRKLEDIDRSLDELHPAGDALYLHCPQGYARSKLSSGKLERDLGVAATGRNWRTVTKLLAML